jgi:hypothetical protein
MALRSTTLIFEARKAVVDEALLPFVAGFRADPMFLAKLPEVGGSEAFHREFYFSFIFRVIFHGISGDRYEGL